MDFMIKKLKANNKLDFWLASSDLFLNGTPCTCGKILPRQFLKPVFQHWGNIGRFQTESCMISDKVLDN